MSYDDKIDKDRLYFTQNNKLIRLHCPECVRTTKLLRHCKIFKNLPGLWWHIKSEHGYISNLLFTTEDIVEILNAISKAKDFGIIPESIPTFVETTTSSSLKYKSRPPRKDVYEKFKKLAELLKIQSILYPQFKLKQLRVYIGVVLGTVDGRTIQNYLDSIIDASEKNMGNGTIDVSEFCAKFEDIISYN
ncbi:MAG: hypothetical protein IIC67_02945 [Thaumarchaeota archaeon]|nr:hypothetical protein [Nitrososphaerota archaeon]